MTTLYGIPNCDTVRKARRWLDSHQVTYRFYDFRKEGIDNAMLNKWIKEVGMDSLINRRGTTWCRLSAEEKMALDQKALIKLIYKYPTLIKRPVVDTGSRILVGFDQDKYTHEFSK